MSRRSARTHFSYAVCYEEIGLVCDTALVFLNVLPVTDTIFVDIPGDSTYTVCGDTLTIFSDPAMDIALCDDDPANGEVSIDGVCVTYTPDEGFGGEEILCVIVCHPDDPTLCDTTIILINVDGLPVAVDDDYNVDEDGVLMDNVADNDTPSGDGGNTWSLVGANGGAVHRTLCGR